MTIPGSSAAPTPAPTPQTYPCQYIVNLGTDERCRQPSDWWYRGRDGIVTICNRHRSREQAYVDIRPIAPTASRPSEERPAPAPPALPPTDNLDAIRHALTEPETCDILTAEVRRLAQRVGELEAENAKLNTPDIFGLEGENDTATPDLGELLDYGGGLHKIWQNRDMGNAWLVGIPAALDDDKVSEWEPEIFPTREAALQAAREAEARLRAGSPQEDEAT